MAIKLGEVKERRRGVGFIEVKRDGLWRRIVGRGVGGGVLLWSSSRSGGRGKVVGDIKKISGVRSGSRWGCVFSWEKFNGEVGNVTWVGDGTMRRVEKKGVAVGFSVFKVREKRSNCFDSGHGENLFNSLWREYDLW